MKGQGSLEYILLIGGILMVVVGGIYIMQSGAESSGNALSQGLEAYEQAIGDTEYLKDVVLNVTADFSNDKLNYSFSIKNENAKSLIIKYEIYTEKSGTKSTIDT